MAQRWYVTKDGRNRLGPYSSRRLRELADEGLLSPDDMVLLEGTTTWARAGDVPGLFPPPPPPTPPEPEPIEPDLVPDAPDEDDEPARPVARPTKFCHACGVVLDARAELCPSCGVRQPGEGWSWSYRRDFHVAIILAVFLGGVGAHWFYLGCPGRGVLHFVLGLFLCLCIFPLVPILLGVIDAVYLLARGPEDFDLVYNGPSGGP